MSSIRRSFASLLAVSALVAACGGGGGAAVPKVAAGTEVGVGLDINADEFAFPNFGSSGTSEVFGSADVVSMFGDTPEVCASGTGAACTLSAEAATWARMVNQARESGHCEGFAVMSAARFMQATTPKTDNLSNEGEVTHGIMRGFATQFVKSVQDETNSWAKKSVAEKVAAIGESLKQGKLDYVLGVYSEHGGHAVLPWKLEYVDENTVKIHVYDSNWPGVDRYVTADLKGNGWSFSFSGKDQTNDPGIWKSGASDMDLASMSSRETGTCPFCKGDARVKSSMFVIRAASLGWSVTSAAGRLSPTQNLVGDDSARPMKAVSTGDTNEDFLLNATIPEAKPITFDLPTETHITGVTPGGAVEVQTSGTQSQVAVNENSVSSPDPSTVLTLASGNFVATANGSNTAITATENGLTVRTETSTGQQVNVVVNSQAPAVEVRTSGTGDVQGGGYQVITQTGTNEITTKTVTETGKVTEVVSQGTIAATSVNVVIPPTLATPAVDTALPPVEERVQVVETTTTSSSSSSSTSSSSTTSSSVPKSTSTSTSTSTTSTTTTSTTTTTSSTTTTVPKTTTSTTTTAPATTTTTIPPRTPWTQHLQSGSDDQTMQVISDAAGNIYSTGSFCGTAVVVGSVTLTNAVAGTCDVYVEKMTHDGTVLWAKRFGGATNDFPDSIAVDGSGNVYVTTHFTSTFSFGNVSVPYTWTGGSYESAYVKFNSAGVEQWARAASSTSIDNLDVSASGNYVYLAAELIGSGGTFELGGMSQVMPVGVMDGAGLVRVDPVNGDAVWLHFWAGYSQSAAVYVSDVTTDPMGNVYVYGQFNGTKLTVGSVDLLNSSSSTIDNDLFLVKVNSAGTVVNASVLGSSGTDSSVYVAVDSSGNAYLSYYGAQGALMIGSSTVVATTAYNKFGVIKVGTTGTSASNVVLLDSSTASTSIGGFAVDASLGVVYLSGQFWNGVLHLGSNTLTNLSASNEDVFYAGFRISDGGLTGWGSVATSARELMRGGNAMIVDPWGNPLIAFDSNSSSITVGSATYTNLNFDTYLVKSNPAGDWP